MSLIAKKATTGTQRSKFTQAKERMNVDVHAEADEKQSSTDDNEPTTPVNIHNHSLSLICMI